MFCGFVKESCICYFFMCSIFFISYLHDFFKFYKAGNSCIYNHMVLILHVELLDVIIFVNHASARECVFLYVCKKVFHVTCIFFIFLKVPNSILFV